MTLTAGSQLGPYKIVSQLGAGGMGVVYQAHDPRLDRSVAIKLLPPDLTRDEIAKQRFLQEAKAASALDHPNICTIFEINETDDGQLFLVMARYEGETLKERIRKGPLELDDAIDMATQVGEGLAEAHKAGIVHRDIKPANLFVTKTGTVKILDFGLAKLADTEGVTQTGTTVGTVAYMSPEQAKGQEVDHRTDIWSLGVVLYEMLAGTPPFAGENLLSLSNAILDGEPMALSGASLSAHSVVTKALNKDKVQRHQAVTDLLKELRALQSGSDAATVATPTKADVPSIAVLPFADMSPEKDQEYFCEGMAEELIDALARLEGLRVSARTSAFQFRGKGYDLAEVGAKLKVRTILEGSVRKAGNRLRINTQLINAEDGYHLWSERYDRDMDDVFAVQDEIARSVVEKLKVKLLGETDAPLVTRQVDDVEAYNLFLKGRFHGSKMTEDSINRALEYFAEALAREPRYARALVGIGQAHSLRGILSIEPPRSAMVKSEAALREALTIDDSLAEAHSALGHNLFWYGWDWDGAEKAFQRALQLDPNHAPALTAYGTLLACLRRGDEGIRLAQRAVDVDPIEPFYCHMLASALGLAGHFNAAIGQAHRTLELDPTYIGAFWILGMASIGLGKYQEAVELMEPGMPLAGGDVILTACLAQALALAGHREEAKQLLNRLRERRRSRYTSPTCLAIACVALNPPDETMRWVETAYEERDPILAVMMQWPVFIPLRSDPRFQALLRKMNFPTA